MGNFYTNTTLRGADPARVAERLEAEGVRAHVSPEIAGGVVVFDRNALEMAFDDPADAEDGADFDVPLALSREFACPALWVMVHDDDILEYALYQEGRLVDRYNSCPGYFDGGSRTPEGGDAETLCRAFGAPGAVDAVEAILRRPAEPGGYIFEMDRHHDLTGALGLPRCAVASGFAYMERGERPEDYDPATWVRTGG